MLLHGLVKQASIVVSLRSVLNIFDIVGTSAPVYALRIWTEVSTWTLIREEQDPVYKQHSCSRRGQCSTVRRRSLDTESLLLPGWSGVGHVLGKGFPSPPDLVSRWAILLMLTQCSGNPSSLEDEGVILILGLNIPGSWFLRSWNLPPFSCDGTLNLYWIGQAEFISPSRSGLTFMATHSLNQLTMGGRVFPLQEDYTPNLPRDFYSLSW